MRIATIGDNCIDIYLPPINKEYVGGCALNTAMHLIDYGFKVSYMGVVGSDHYSDIIRQSLRQKGIDITHLYQAEGLSSITETRITDGQKTIVKEDLGAQLEFATSHNFSDEQLFFLSGFDYIYYTGFTSWQFISPENKRKIKDNIIRNLELLDKLSGKIIFDYAENKLAGLLENSLGMVDFAFFSLEELEKEDAVKFARQILKGRCSLVGITQGARGAVLVNNDEVAYIPTSAASIVDTLGAGDSFIGTFIARYLLGDSLETSGQKAADAAGNICQQLGGWGKPIKK